MRTAIIGSVLLVALAAAASCGSDNSALTSPGGGAGSSGLAPACTLLRACCATMAEAQAKACVGAAEVYEGSANGADLCGNALAVYQQTGLCAGAGGSGGAPGDGGIAGMGGGPAGSGGGPACSQGLSDCAGTCVDVSTNVDHCGGCFKKCPQDNVCTQGACQALPKSCPCPLESYCDLATNSCKTGCLADMDCSTGRYCDTASRTCKPGCRGDANCGQNETCNMTSRVCDCISGHHRCSGACVTNQSVEHCGQQCSPCTAPAGGTATCDGTNCGFKCNTGYHPCGASCLSNQSTDSCGTLCTPCPTEPNGTALCSNGSCTIQCNPGAHMEGGHCVLDQTCVGQTCSGHGTCSVSGGMASCTCDTGYVPQGLTCVPKSCTQDSNCPIEFWCSSGACAPGCHADETRCPEGMACKPSGSSWACTTSCYQANTNYPPYECNGTDWKCLGNSRCRHLCSTDAGCASGDKCATFAINSWGYWSDIRACVKSCKTDPSECGEAYDNDNGACTCAADGLCRDPANKECRLPNYSSY